MKARKEITLAVIIGLIIGLVVVGGILRARTALNRRPSLPSSSPFASGTVVVEGLSLTIETVDNQVLSEPSLEISGKTLPQAYVVILGEAGEHILVPSELGVFSQDVELVAGANTIHITSYLEDGTKAEKIITAVYSTAEI